MTTFADLGLSPTLVATLSAEGLETPTEIQARCIPLGLARKDLVAQAQTGSGKTAAFLLPILERMSTKRGVEAVVLVPTRELANQVVAEAQRFAPGLGDRIVSIIGGQSPLRQIELVNRGAKIIVATPGRLLDLLSSKRLKNVAPSAVVLDEADEILDMGFLPDVDAILKLLGSERQTVLFSATMPPAIKRLADEELRDPEKVLLIPRGELAHERVSQTIHVLRPAEKSAALVRLLEAEAPPKAIVFCRTRKDVDEVGAAVNRAGIKALCLHGDVSQNERERIIGVFKSGHCAVVVATDVASRGLDVAGLTHVFNYHLPEEAERFIHRVGRTGRGGEDGKAITLVTEREWLSHRFFHRYPRKRFTIATVPTRSATVALRDQRLLSEVSGIEANAEMMDELSSRSPEELMRLTAQLLCYVRDQKRVKGEEKIGYDPAEVSGLRRDFGRSGQKRGSFRGGRPSQGRSYGKGRRDGGGKGKSGGGKRPFRAAKG